MYSMVMRISSCRPPRGGVSRNYTNMDDVNIPGGRPPRGGVSRNSSKQAGYTQEQTVAPHAGA